MNTKYFFIATLYVLLLSLPSFAQGKKFGYINSNDLLLQMPERKEAETKMQEDAKKLDEQLSSMATEYQTKLKDYQDNAKTMSDLIKQTKEKELTDLETRIRDFRDNAQSGLRTKEQELLKPIIEKAKKAIDDVANENGYAYVFDSGMGFMLHYPSGDDIMPLVKKKLGLK